MKRFTAEAAELRREKLVNSHRALGAVTTYLHNSVTSSVKIP